MLVQKRNPLIHKSQVSSIIVVTAQILELKVRGFGCGGKRSLPPHPKISPFHIQELHWAYARAVTRDLLKNNFPRPSSSGITIWTSLPVETRKSLSESSNGENKSLFGNNTVGDYSFTGPNRRRRRL
jgi:hypothetical protein